MQTMVGLFDEDSFDYDQEAAKYADAHKNIMQSMSNVFRKAGNFLHRH